MARYKLIAEEVTGKEFQVKTELFLHLVLRVYCVGQGEAVQRDQLDLR